MLPKNQSTPLQPSLSTAFDFYFMTHVTSTSLLPLWLFLSLLNTMVEQDNPLYNKLIRNCAAVNLLCAIKKTIFFHRASWKMIRQEAICYRVYAFLTYSSFYFAYLKAERNNHSSPLLLLTCHLVLFLTGWVAENSTTGKSNEIKFYCRNDEQRKAT